MKNVALLAEEEYLLAMRQRVDELKARAELPRFKYATESRAKVVAHFVDRAIQMGEAAFRTRDLPIPLDILMRVLCDDLIRVFWVSQSDSNTAEYVKAPISEMAKMMRVNIEKGHARIVHRPTGHDASNEFLPKLSPHIVKGKHIEQMATECGLEKIYGIVFRGGSLAVHGNTFSIYNTSEDSALDARSTLPAINAFLLAIARIADNVPDRITQPDEILGLLGIRDLAQN